MKEQLSMSQNSPRCSDANADSCDDTPPGRHSHSALRAHILRLSKASEFSLARQEWEFTHAALSDDWGHCACGHPIKEFCFIRNTTTQQETYVGNVCLDLFLGVDITNVFKGLRKYVQDPYANATKDLITYARWQGLINEYEYNFLQNMRRKRNFTEKQLNLKYDINRKIWNGMHKL